ncbi:MAG TPA: hypothetical protein VGK67_19050 [Myxococcales bacterium]
MSRRKKPGTPGKTTLPRDVVSAVTEFVQAEFKKRGSADYLDVFVVAQQCFIYLETADKAREAFGRPLPKPRVTTSSTTHSPLGRLKFLGTTERWEFQPYRWSDELWEDVEYRQVGTLDDLVDMMLSRA